MKKGLTSVSEACSLAFHAMAILAQSPQAWHRAEDIARALDASVHHLLKIFQRLKKAGLVLSTPGPKGGHRLAKEAQNVSLLDIYRAIEGDLPKKPCLFGRSACRAKSCPFAELLEEVNEKARLYFSQKRLSDLKLTLRETKRR
ncbi:MAG TPA: Rrf2 family transcriptional regulator [Syntrophales bacterium]|nr:Rrf2 family transcriptional regulator [Syntrophales bacterium]